MWNHLDSDEQSRRLAILETATVTGGLSSDYYSPAEILGVWAFHTSDTAKALAWWGYSQWESAPGDPFDPRTPQSEIDYESGEFNLLKSPDALFALWLDDPFWDGLAEHPLLPPDAFASLPQLQEESGRSGLTRESGNQLLTMVARNAALDADTYEWLWSQVPDAHDGVYDSTELAVTLIGNPATPPERLNAVTPLDGEWFQTFYSGPDDDVMREHDIAENVAYASHPGLPVETLAALADDVNPAVRRTVAANPRAPLEFLQRLAIDDNPDVRAAVIFNSKSTDELAASSAPL